MSNRDLPKSEQVPPASDEKKQGVGLSGDMPGSPFEQPVTGRASDEKKQDEEPKPEEKSEKPQGIEVVAARPGFWKGERKAVGDKFVIPSKKQLGMWMQCVDPRLEKEHQEEMRNKRKERNAYLERQAEKKKFLR